MPIPTNQIVERIRQLDARDLTMEALEKCKEIIPTEQETKQLLAYDGDTNVLRDVERNMLPFCYLKRVPQKLDVLLYMVQSPAWRSDLQREAAILAVRFNLNDLCFTIN